MKNFLVKNWILIGWILAFLLDQSTYAIEYITPDLNIQNLIRGVGALILSYYWTSKRNEKVVAIRKKALNKIK